MEKRQRRIATIGIIIFLFLICNNCVIKENEKDNWNLAEQTSLCLHDHKHKDILHIKTFIQKIKEDILSVSDLKLTKYKVSEIIDKRAGDL